MSVYVSTKMVSAAQHDALNNARVNLLGKEALIFKDAPSKGSTAEAAPSSDKVDMAALTKDLDLSKLGVSLDGGSSHVNRSSDGIGQGRS